MNTEKRLYLACEALIDNMIRDQASGDSGNWELTDVPEYVKGVAAMEEYKMQLGPLPEWAVAHNITDELVPGLQLFTRNGRRHGNAHIIDKRSSTIPGSAKIYYDVITDAGSVIREMAEDEVLEGWEPGDFISDPAAVMKRFGRVPTDLLDPE